MLWEHTPAATVPYLGLGAEISLVGYVLKTPPVGILDVPFLKPYFRKHSIAMLMLRGEARKTGGFPEQANCNDGVKVMSQRTGGKGCLYSHTSSPG